MGAVRHVVGGRCVPSLAVVANRASLRKKKRPAGWLGEVARTLVTEGTDNDQADPRQSCARACLDFMFASADRNLAGLSAQWPITYTGGE